MPIEDDFTDVALSGALLKYISSHQAYVGEFYESVNDYRRFVPYQYVGR